MGRDNGDSSDDSAEEPKGFLEEVFEHRQRQPAPSVEPADTAENTAAVEPVTDAGSDAEHPGSHPGPGLAGGSGTIPAELEASIDEPLDASPAPDVRELDSLEHAVIDEAMKKSGLVWVDVGSGRTAQAMWYVWLAGAAYVLTGSGEQPDPGLSAALVRVSARSKETRSRIVAWTGSAARVDVADSDWDEVASALAKARLNLAEPATAPQRWAADPSIVIYRITPTGPLTEAPGRYSDTSGRAAPVATAATTAGPPPKVVHRRQTARRPLS